MPHSKSVIPLLVALIAVGSTTPTARATQQTSDSTLVSSGDFIAWAERQVCNGTEPAVLLGWEPVPGVLGDYRVFRTDGEYAAVVDPDTEGYTHLVSTGLEYEGTHDFFVTAETITGTLYSDIIRVYVVNQECLVGHLSNQPPGPFMPRNEPFFCKDGAPAVKIRWSSSPGATSYTIERVSPSEGTDITVEGITANEFLDDQALTPGVQHIYIMTAVNHWGTWRTSFRHYLSLFPPPDLCSTAGLPGPFTLTAGTPFCQSGEPAVQLTFTRSDGADSRHRIVVNGPAGFDGSGSATVSGSGPYEYTREGLRAGAAHRFFAIAKDPNDPSKVRYSNTEHVRVPLNLCTGFDRPPDTYSMEPIAVTSTSAILRSTVWPNGSPTSMHFQWGETAAYGLATQTLDLGATVVPRYVTTQLEGLSCDTEYHFRATATNVHLTTYGDDIVFTTDPCDFCGPDDLILDNMTIVGIQHHEACQAIRIGPNTEVLSGAGLHATAPTIVLEDGFSVASGGSFSAGPR